MEPPPQPPQPLPSLVFLAVQIWSVSHFVEFAISSLGRSCQNCCTAVISLPSGQGLRKPGSGGLQYLKWSRLYPPWPGVPLEALMGQSLTEEAVARLRTRECPDGERQLWWRWQQSLRWEQQWKSEAETP